MGNTVKSVFKQRELEKLYELEYWGGYYSCTGDFIDHNAKLVAVINEENVISDKTIGVYDIEIPMLEIGDKFFLHDIQEVIKVKSKMRSSDGSIVYYVEDKAVETENTKKTYFECREKIEHYRCERTEIENTKRELNACKKAFEKYKEEYKYKHKFFNFE